MSVKCWVRRELECPGIDATTLNLTSVPARVNGGDQFKVIELFPIAKLSSVGGSVIPIFHLKQDEYKDAMPLSTFYHTLNMLLEIA